MAMSHDDKMSRIKARRLLSGALLDLTEADQVVEDLGVDSEQASEAKQRFHDAVEQAVAEIEGAFSLIEVLK